MAFNDDEWAEYDDAEHDAVRNHLRHEGNAELAEEHAEQLRARDEATDRYQPRTLAYPIGDDQAPTAPPPPFPTTDVDTAQTTQDVNAFERHSAELRTQESGQTAGTPAAPQDPNQAAVFLPATEPHQLPAVQVAGLLVTVYHRTDGSFTVAIDSDDACELGHADGCPNLRVVVNEARIYDDTATARAARTNFTVYVSDSKPEPTIQHYLHAITNTLRM